MDSTQSRRHFLTTLSAAGAAGIFGSRRSLADEAPPETTTIRLAKIPSICIAPQYVCRGAAARGGLHGRALCAGATAGRCRGIARGEVDFSLHFSPEFIIPVDAGSRSRSLAGCMPDATSFSRTKPSAPSRPEGQECRHVPARSSGSPVPGRSWPAMSGSILHKDIDWVDERYGQANGAFQRRKDRCVSRLSA